MDEVDLGPYDAAVLGAGISGLVSASVLLRQGARRVLIADEYPQVGGNHIDRTIGDFTFDVGSLIFQDDSPLLSHFPDLLAQYVPVEPSWGRLNPQGLVTAYPLSGKDDLVAAGLPALTRMAGSAVWGRLRRRHLRSAQDFAEHWLGAYFVHRTGLGSYMERFCGVPPAEVDVRFAEQRMDWVARYAHLSVLADRVVRAVRRTGDDVPTNRQLVRPRDGFAHLYAPAVESLTAQGVTFCLGRPLESLRKTKNGFSLRVGGIEHRSARVISTIPLERALTLASQPNAGPLPTVTLVTLFFSFRGERGFEQSVFYNFSHDGAWKRLTMHSDFYGVTSGREFFSVEVVGRRIGRSPDLAEADFRAHTAANGLFTGDLVLEGSHVLEHAYPVFTRGSAERAEAAIRTLRDLGVESLGRQGGYQYQPTSRVSTEEAERSLAVTSDLGAEPATTPHQEPTTR